MHVYVYIVLLLLILPSSISFQLRFQLFVNISVAFFICDTQKQCCKLQKYISFSCCGCYGCCCCCCCGLLLLLLLLLLFLLSNLTVINDFCHSHSTIYLLYVCMRARMIIFLLQYKRYERRDKSRCGRNLH